MKVVKRRWKGADGKSKWVWRMDYIDPVTRKRKRPMIKGVTSKEMAERIAGARYEEMCVRAGLGKAAGPSRRAQGLTIEQLLEDHCARVGVKPRTLALDEHRGKSLMRLLGKSTRVMDVTREMLEKYQKARLAEGCGPCGVNGDLRTLHAAMKRASENDDSLPAVPKFPSRLAEPGGSQRALTIQEVCRLIEGCRTLPTGVLPSHKKYEERKRRHRDLAEFVTVLAFTGMRPCEVWSLKWGEWDQEMKVLRKRSPKRGGGDVFRSRTLPLLDYVQQALLDRRKRAMRVGADDYIFGTAPEDRGVSPRAKHGKGVSYGDVFLGDHRLRVKLKAAAERAGIIHPEQVTPYVLRHSFATNYPGDLGELQRFLGHADIRTTMVYRKTLQDSMLKAVEKMAKAGGVAQIGHKATGVSKKRADNKGRQRQP